MVATAGSCFAQHVSRSLKSAGFNFFVAEPAPTDLPENLATERHYGLFSARFGNIYTPRQLVQLFDRAFGSFIPTLDAWSHPVRDDCVIDPFRPQIQRDGFASIELLLDDRQEHLACVRRMFEELDVFVFTLGLTEAWVHRDDGAVVPLAPGVAGGRWPATDFQFHNFSVDEVRADLNDFLARLRRVNPGSRVIFTVSPVPLAATYEDAHVLCSTTYSKSVLRVAVDEVCRHADAATYFPSFEIITGAQALGRYWDDDLRSVRPSGVAHVMRCFLRHFTNESDAAGRLTSSAESDDRFKVEALNAAAVLCDEDAIRRN